MGIVQVLPDHVANQIAAGEVVERPASVVKELVENALDAGATRVRVEIEDGGKSLIRIIDNGMGMTPEDAMLALRRHATSKVRSADDLESIDSLGFRGEALPSIRSVSRFSLRTRTPDSDEGIRIVADGALAPELEPVGCPQGTDISVRHLFFNTPARRKFLKRTATEMSRIGELMDRFALGWPHVHFTLIHNGKRRHERPADRDLQARILSVLGRDVCRRLFPVRLEMGEHSVIGFTSEPSFHRSNPRGMYTYINGRFVRDKVIQHAITQAYGTLLDRGRYPTCVLYLVLPPTSVDVNVHPAKAEVRFVESGAVHGLIERALRLTLADAPWGHGDDPSGPQVRGPLGGEGTELDELPLLFADRLAARGAAPPTWTQPGEPFEPGAPGVDTAPPPDDWSRPTEPPSAPPTFEGRAPDEPGAPGFFARLRYIGQAGRCYLLCESPHAMHVIDQHAAHERILFERLKASLGKGGIQTQRMLFPLPVTLEPTLARAAEEHAELVAQVGVGIEPFGGSEWVITEVPHLLAERDPVTLATELLSELAESGTSREVERRLEHILATMACHGSVRAGDVLTPDEAKALLRQMDGVPLRANCPHGRPVVVSYPFDRVARWFDRS